MFEKEAVCGEGFRGADFPAEPTKLLAPPATQRSSCGSWARSEKSRKDARDSDIFCLLVAHARAGGGCAPQRCGPRWRLEIEETAPGTTTRL